jgi:hypothetical protein
MIPFMSFESLGHRERPQRNDDEEFDQAEQRGTLENVWEERIERMARFAALTAALVAPAGLAHAGEIDLSNATERSEVAHALDAKPSTGSITLASGETVQIPTKADHFNKVTVYTPREGKAWRVVILFQQNHLLTAEDMQGFSDDAKRAYLDAVERSQKIIYEELETLGKKGVIKSVCQEGIIASPDNKNAKDVIGNIADPKQFDAMTTRYVGPYLPAAQEAADRYYGLTLRPGEPNAAESDELTRIEPFMHSIRLQDPHVLGAAEIWAAESAAKSKGVNHLCGAEEPETYAAAWAPEVRAIMVRPPAEWTLDGAALVKKRVVDDREDAALRQTLAQKGPVVALEFGAGHAFTAATMRWNIKHPLQQIALVQADAFQLATVDVKTAGKSGPIENETTKLHN